MAKRKALSKRTRFAVFARDGFKCRYCGHTSEEVTLVVDHLIAVANGGTDDSDNLVTACETCNQGKAATAIDTAPDDTLARLSREQEMREQEHAADVAKRAVEARKEFRQIVCNLWCEIRGTSVIQNTTLNVMTNYAERYGVPTVAGWIEKAHNRLENDSDYDVGRYVSGIRRSLINEGKL